MRRTTRTRHHQPTGPTVTEWATVWLADRARRVRPTTLATDTSVINRWVLPTIGDRHLSTITPADVRTVEDTVRNAGLSTTTARYAVGTLKRLLRAAAADGHGIQPHTLLTRAPARAVHDRADIPLPDVTALLQAARGTPGGSRWVAGFHTGMRQAECLGLTWDQVNLDAATIDVAWQLQRLPRAPGGGFRVPDGYEARWLTGVHHLTRPKSKAGHRVIPITPQLGEALNRHRATTSHGPWGLLWATPAGRPLTPAQDRAAWVALQDTARVACVDGTRGRRYYIHEIRHTTATLLLGAGVDPHVLTGILGHSTVTTSRGYQHVSLAGARAALTAATTTLNTQETE